ncbi:MAG: hypothetical protein PHS84_10855 [Paludibacter sp.]|nr:hypothetical protein [Paludibacter sp.]
MNRKQIDLSEMIESVSKVLDDNASLISDKPSIVAVNTKLKENMVEVKELKQKQAVSTKPNYTIKEYKKEDMIANLLVVKAGVTAVGIDKNDVKLKTISEVTESAIKNMRESDLVVYGHDLYVAAMTIPAELLVWGVTQDEIDDLGDSTDSYLDQNPTIRNIKAKSSQATTEIKGKLNVSLKLIKETLDPLIEPFKKMNPTFYGEYQNTRIIVSHAATHPKPDEKPAV